MGRMKINIVVKDGIYQYMPLEYEVPSVPRINDTIFLVDHELVDSDNNPLPEVLLLDVFSVYWTITKTKTDVCIHAHTWTENFVSKKEEEC